MTELGEVVVVHLVLAGTASFLTHSFFWQIASYGYRPLQSASHVHPTSN
jgi:hypothetical protein